MSQFEVLIIGGGPNGLACATVCAKAGRKVAVVESRSVFGGQAAGESFHPGFTAPGIHHDTSQLRPFVIEALDLKSHGLEYASSSEDVWVMNAEGDALHVTDSGEHLTPEDQRGWGELNTFLDTVRPLLIQLLDDQPRDVLKTAQGDWMPLLKPGLSLRRLGGDFMLELFRVPPMCAADWVSEFVTDDRLRAHLSYDGIIRSYTGPWSPGTAADLLIHRTLRGPAIKGGGRAVAQAMEQAAKAAGVTLLGDHHVEEILVTKGSATGVRLKHGEMIESKTVVATCDPRRTLRELLDSSHVPYHTEHHATHYRGEGIAAKLHLALKAPVSWKGIPGGASHVRIMDSLDALEQTFDPVRHGAFFTRPTLDVQVSGDPASAPEGQQVMSVWVHGVPYAMEGGWDEANRGALVQAVMSVLEGVTQGLGDSVIATELLTPVDMAERYHTYRGHVFHGDHALDQLLIRPIPECATYETFVPGLSLGGSGSFPGGGLTGAPGVLCARRLLGG